ncbi:methyltransferase domain-containing protein [Sphingobium sp.]|uniref:class I SAM-dependent methyltransferase n=1 Tax=Sphingobium sp. TaxID=1912891 RepID=UPI0028BF2FEC|nr:methyltransferase domain-containing protein [Sphingobium sp.]
MAENSISPATSHDDYQQLAAESAVSTENLVRTLAIPAGARVLDIACGTGHAALAAARRRAVVTGIDLNAQSLERARIRAEAEGLAGIDFLEADAAKIPFEDGSFDIAISTLGLVFLPDQEAAAHELARVVRPGGLIAITAYTTNSIPSKVYDLVSGILKPPSAPARPHYAWSQGPRAGELLNPYFDAVRVQYDSYDTCFASPAASFEHLARWNPAIRMAVQQAPEAAVKTLRDGYIAILESFNRATDGSFVANMDFAVVTGVRKR